MNCNIERIIALASDPVCRLLTVAGRSQINPGNNWQSRLSGVLISALVGWSTLVGQSAQAQSPADPPARHSTRPNLLLIVADDLGFSDLGAFGGEIDTPHLDRLAKTGVRMTSFYASPTCSPSRAMLLTGVDHHRAGLGSMGELLAENQRGKPGYEGHLNHKVVTVATLLREAGYQTYMTGKWHLGQAPDQLPHARGFEQAFAMLAGGAGHFDDTGLYPEVHPAPFSHNGKRVGLPEGFDYSSDFYTDKLMEFVAGGESEKPFFAYLSFTAPHWPLQAPPETIAKYAGRYDAGPAALRKARLRRMQALNLITKGAVPHPFVPAEPEWDQLSEAERKREARKMEIFAAMVDKIDSNIGRLLSFLERRRALDNTVIIFLSDNGPEGTNIGRSPLFADWIKRFDNSYANMGSATSYVFYGPHWAEASSAPARLYKSHTSEGGIKVPAFITVPGIGRAGTIANTFATVKDITPTLLDFAGVAYPGVSYRERDLYPISGKSLLPWLTGKATNVHGKDFIAGWELFGRRAIREGDWKLIYLREPFGPERWQLYNLASDPGETRDLAADYPKLVARLKGHWADYMATNGVILPQGNAGY